jgi:uncharacterized protein (TIGR03000 family)
MSRRLAILIAPLALLFGTNFAQAQHHGGGGHGGGMHMGGGHMGGMHMGGMHHGGFGGNRGIGGYYGGLGYGGLGYGGFGYGGLGYGGLGYGGLGYGGRGYGGYGGYGYGGLGYGYGMGSAYGYSPGYSSGYYSAAPSVLGAPALGSSYSAPATTSTEPAAAVVNLTVPAGATVWLDGKETAAKDGKVTFTSPVMQPGARAVLNIKARWNDSTREMNLPITAGDKMGVDLRNQ